MAEDQAYVTLATDDTYGLGALVLAHSLKRFTNRKLVVLVSPNVTPHMRSQLSSVFDEVREVNVLDSKDEARLALMARPELGVTLTKIHCWCLTHYSKAVFLDADTLVVQNCDELFDREELSAVADVGWPDCFNSGVFVFRPSEETFRALLNHAREHGSFDGGDQGLLNSYFSDWRTKDISRHLSFIYNMNSNASYTYLPAYKQFGSDVKIIHFLGPVKPWMHRYHPGTGRLDVFGDCRHLEEHLRLWWNIFATQVQPFLQPDCAGLAGALSRVSLEEGEGRTPETAASSQARRHAWERGQIDYLGSDAFSNIERKLDAAIDGV
ncbi:glycogenin-1-like isoform X3 [Centruroides sculpturatus]|uniref:glycogenin-1-like isoform X2 n=1 Tax=Centruroides sculpturatus TaxID=218467 RepID=UPI000C6E2464|nr:glycogenin-1-like isoform X2 [Centruroides sculpturatus]XP_023228299.1 glycogenin-1-like isoform X3 [Centruroides sculpturatus]